MEKMQCTPPEQQQRRLAEKRPLTLPCDDEEMTNVNFGGVEVSTSKRKRLLENCEIDVMMNAEENGGKQTTYIFDNGCKFCNGLDFCWWHNVD